jgi:hypothetical protein
LIYSTPLPKKKAPISTVSKPLEDRLAAINRSFHAIEPFSFDQIYGGWWETNVLADAKAAVTRSADRYLHAIAQT